jgi:succinoglycan biosynthesis transport protein ExoP
MNPQNDIELRWILSVISRRFWIILLFMLLGGIIAFIVLSYIPLTYKADAKIMVEPAQNTQTNEYDTLAAAERLAFTYSQMMKNSEVLQATIDNLGLAATPELLLKKISAEPIKDTHLILLSVVDSSPDQAATLDNALASAFIQYNRTLQEQKYTGLIKENQDKINQLKLSILQIQDNIDALNSSATEDQTKLSDLKQSQDDNKSDYRLMQKNLEDIQLNLQQLDNHVIITDLAQPPWNDIPYTFNTVTTTLQINPNPIISGNDYSSLLAGERLASTYVQVILSRPIIEASIAKMGTNDIYEDLIKNVHVKTIPGTLLMRVMVRGRDSTHSSALANTIAQEFIDQNKSNYQANYTSQQTDIENQMKMKSAVIGQIESEINSLSLRIKQSGSEVSRLEKLVNEYQNERQNLEQNAERINLEINQSADSLTIVEPAIPPNKPVQNRMMLIFLAVLVGALEGIAVVFIVQYFDDKIRTAEDVKMVLGSVSVGEINRTHKKDPELLVSAQPQTFFSEQFRVFATTIRRNLDSRSPHNILLVTSSTPSEGKTFVSANLAIALADANMQIILVDADLRRPRIHELFKVEESLGIAEILQDKSKIMLKTTDIKGLKLLSGGLVIDNPDRVLNSPKLFELFSNLKKDADAIIVDCPPILSLSDTQILAGQSDGIIVVVRAGQTVRKVAREAKIILQQMGSPLIGIVLNDVTHQNSHQSYYYDYYRHKERGSIFQRTLKKVEEFAASIKVQSNKNHD